MKEVTGHKSDAVDAYQITSDLQRQEMSNIIQNNQEVISIDVPNKVEVEKHSVVEEKVDKK